MPEHNAQPLRLAHNSDFPEETKGDVFFPLKPLSTQVEGVPLVNPSTPEAPEKLKAVSVEVGKPVVGLGGQSCW